jgi:transposase
MANQYTSRFYFKSKKDEGEARNLARNNMIENRIALRMRILLLRSEGKTQTETADILTVHRNTVRAWEKRYASEGIKGLYDKPGRGRRPGFSP